MDLHVSTANLLLLDGAAHNVDRVLRHNDVIVLGLEHLLDGARVLLGILDENPLLRVFILTQKGRTARPRLHVVVEQKRFILLHGDFRSMGKHLLVGNLHCRNRRRYKSG